MLPVCIIGKTVDRDFSKSFAYRMNINGPKHDSCGMSHVTFFFEFFHSKVAILLTTNQI